MTDPSLPGRKLWLFDIDGTLLTTGGAGERAFRAALADCFPLRDEVPTIDFAGATDTGVMAQLFAHHGIASTPENRERFRTVYLDRLAANLPASPGRVLPGVPELLDRVTRRPEWAVGLLTGNFAASARMKLVHYGLADSFDFGLGAFADDDPDRNCLGPVALRRARAQYGAGCFADPGRDVLILGDTPRDVACARACGARVVAVATGRHDRAALAACGPDVVLDGFPEVDPFALWADPR